MKSLFVYESIDLYMELYNFFLGLELGSRRVLTISRNAMLPTAMKSMAITDIYANLRNG